MNTVEKLIEICKSHTISNAEAVVLVEPYIPCIPDPWNGILVLAESQNLSATNNEYVDHLKEMSVGDRITRLGYSSKDSIGVQPWDDGSIKLAVEAAFSVNSAEVGVSNSVLWSQRGNNNQNANPDFNIQLSSSKIWKEMLFILMPKKIICCGKIAQHVIEGSGYNGVVINLRLPSPNAISRVSGMFSEYDLLARYPEVKRVIDNKPDLLTGGYRQNKIFFACHAVSVAQGIHLADEMDS